MMNVLKVFLLFVVTIMFSLDTISANEYEIKIKIEGDFNDTTILLTSYFGEKIKIIDTAYAIKQGEFVFEGQIRLPGGIYMVVSMQKKKLFEFIVDANQKFKLSTNTSNYAGNMKVSGSTENELFYSYLVHNEQQFKINQSIIKEIDSLVAISENTDYLKNALDSLNKASTTYKLNIISDNEGTFVSALLNAMRDVVIPDSVINSSDSTLSYKYLKKHYWDYFDLSDSALLRTPIFMRKTNQYFKQMVVFHPDSVISAIDFVISKAQPSQEVVGYLVWHFISEYQNPQFMGFDKVFVHLVDEYFSNEYILNTTPSILKSLQDRADKIRPILLGEMAPDLILIDTAGAYISFKAIPNNYTVLFFWDSDCGVCTKEIVELRKLYEHHDYDIEVFAINVNSDLDKWKKAMHEKEVSGINVNGTRSVTRDFHDLYDIYGTPVIYLLDGDKKIIAKRIGANKIMDFINNYK